MSLNGAKLYVPSHTLLRGSQQFQRQLSKLTAHPVAADAVKPSDLPDAFDGQTVWAPYLPPIKDQCQCGGCWAFAVTACLAARINIWTKNHVHLDLSPSKLIVCNWGGDAEGAIVRKAYLKDLDFSNVIADIAAAVKAVGCSGETLIGAWQYLYRYGAVTEACQPYVSRRLDLCSPQGVQALPSCTEMSGPNMDTCLDGQPEKQYRAGGYYYVSRDSDSATVAAIKAELWKFGPVTTGMQVYDDLFSWDGRGVYRWNGTAPLSGGHAVVITGWGTLPGEGPYWQVRNSWGAEWGDRGYFRIVAGEDHCQIESNCVTGYPDMLMADNFLLNQRLSSPEDLFLRNVWEEDPSGYDKDRIDEMVLGQRPPLLLTFAFPARLVPDFATMIAGQPWTIRFPYARLHIHWGLFIFNAVLALALLALALQWRHV